MCLCTDKRFLKNYQKKEVIIKLKGYKLSNEPQGKEAAKMADCNCKANSSIHCTVSQCAHHCGGENYCTLDRIDVGTHEANPTMVECVDCNSFRRK